MIIGLAACSTQPQQIDISTRPVDKPTLTLPPVDELQMREVTWIVINQDNIDEVQATFAKNGSPFAVYALDGKGYGNLSLNFSDIRALVQQQQAIIAAYRNYYEAAERSLDNAVILDE